MELKQQAKPRKQVSFFHRKIARSGGSRYMAVGKILPDDWLIVRVRIAKLEGKNCLLEIVKLD